MATRVYQIIIDEAKHDEVNQSEWNEVVWGADYLDITTGAWKEGLAALIGRVIDQGLVVHTMTVETDNLDDVFATGNGFPPNSGFARAAVIHRTGKSISIGDIMVNAETHEGYIVATVGFIRIDPAIIREMECNVATVILAAHIGNGKDFELRETQ